LPKKNQTQVTSNKSKALHVNSDAMFVKSKSFFREFVKALRDFARIFTKSTLLRVRLHPLHPRLLHQYMILIGNAVIKTTEFLLVFQHRR